MTSIALSRRAAELLGPTPDGSINWDEVIRNQPRTLVSHIPLLQHVPIETMSPSAVDVEKINGTSFDVHDDEDDDGWLMNAKKRPRAKANIRRVTLETTQRSSPLVENSHGSSPISRRKLRRLEKRRKQMNLKQSTIMESFGLSRSA